MSTVASPQRRSHHERLDQAFFALSNRTRRKLLTRLGTAPLRLSDLAAPLDMTLPAASKHLKVLERARLVRRSVEGREHWFSLNPRALDEAQAWLQRNRIFWEDTLRSLAAHVEDEPRG